MPAWLPYAIAGGAGLLKKVFGGDKSSGPTAYEKNMMNTINSYIKQGGIGLTDEQLGQEYKSFRDPLMRDAQSLRVSANENLAGRGLLKSGAVPRFETRMNEQLINSLTDKWRSLKAENQARKQQSLLSLLGMGSELAGAYGQAERDKAMGESSLWDALIGEGLTGFLDKGGGASLEDAISALLGKKKQAAGTKIYDTGMLA